MYFYVCVCSNTTLYHQSELTQTTDTNDMQCLSQKQSIQSHKHKHTKTLQTTSSEIDTQKIGIILMRVRLGLWWKNAVLDHNYSQIRNAYWYLFLDVNQNSSQMRNPFGPNLICVQMEITTNEINKTIYLRTVDWW